MLEEGAFKIRLKRCSIAWKPNYWVAESQRAPENVWKVIFCKACDTSFILQEKEAHPLELPERRLCGTVVAGKDRMAFGPSERRLLPQLWVARSSVAVAWLAGNMLHGDGVSGKEVACTKVTGGCEGLWSWFLWWLDVGFVSLALKPFNMGKTQDMYFGVFTIN